MVKFQELNCNSLDEYLECFYDKLLPTNHNFTYFVNWEKVFSKLKKQLVPINILNSLNKVEDNEVELKFREILNDYPEVVPLLPLILAIRYENKGQIDIFDDYYKVYDFSIKNFNPNDIIYFCRETGILNLFTEIDDLYSYLIGVEVGLDTNARKNRSGFSFKSILEKMLNKEIEKFPEYTVRPQSSIPSLDINGADFIISKNDVEKIIIKCNFYNGSGSKPVEVAKSCVQLQNSIKDNNMIFLWVTDGQGWKKMTRNLEKVSPEIDYLVNFTILKENLNHIIKQLED